jgi:hypothetical protein
MFFVSLFLVLITCIPYVEIETENFHGNKLQLQKNFSEECFELVECLETGCENYVYTYSKDEPRMKKQDWAWYSQSYSVYYVEGFKIKVKKLDNDCWELKSTIGIGDTACPCPFSPSSIK